MKDDCGTNTSTVEVQAWDEWQCTSTDDEPIVGFDHLADHGDIRMSDAGTIFALMSIVREDATVDLRVFSWANRKYERRGGNILLGAVPLVADARRSINPWSLALSGQGTVTAVSLCTTPRSLEVFEWDGIEWISRPSPSIGDVECNWGENGQYPTTSHLELSHDGKTLALAGGFLDTKVSTQAFEWTGTKWESLGGDILRGGKENSLSLFPITVSSWRWGYPFRDTATLALCTSIPGQLTFIVILGTPCYEFPWGPNSKTCVTTLVDLLGMLSITSQIIFSFREQAPNLRW